VSNISSLAPTHLATKKPTYYAALTGVRALAAYMVFFHHSNPFDPDSATVLAGFARTHGGELSRRLVEQWHVGVAIFFVLSGFLIATQYQDRAKLDWAWFRRYMQNRFARIYPLYFVLTVIAIAAWWIGFAQMYQISPGPSTPLSDKLLISGMNLTFLRGFFSRFLLSGVGAGWSLTTETSFYLLAPFVLVATRYHVKRLALFLLSLFALGLVLVAVAKLSPVYLYGFMGSIKFMLNWTIFGRATEFAIGIALALFIKHKPAAQRATSYATAIGLSWILLAVGLIILNQYPAYRVMDEETYLTIFLTNVVLPLGVAVFFWGLVHEQTLLRKGLESRLLDTLGRSSYAFYLVHGGLLPFLLLKYTHSLTLIFLLTLGVAYLLWRFIEEPLHKKLRAM
jgi:peptidoglycan/LPS O-acetylase OafA/YrhL